MSKDGVHMPDYTLAPSSPRINTIGLPLLVGVLLGALVAGLVWKMHEDQQAALRTALVEQAHSFAEDVQLDMGSRVRALQRIVSRWEFSGGTPKSEFVNDVEAYLSDLPGFQAIEWVDKEFIVRWVVPLAGNERALDLNIGFEKNRRIALEKAKMGRKPTMSNPIDLVQGGKGILVYFPIFVRGEFDGFILAVFRTHDWLSYVLRFNEKHDQLKGVRFSVGVGGITAFEQPGLRGFAATEFDAHVGVEIMGHLFTVYSRPTTEFLDNAKSMLPLVTGIVGAALSILVSFVVFFFQKASAEAWLTYSAKKNLEKEVHERIEAERKLQQASWRLALATKAGGIGIWNWDVQANALSWDDNMFELYDVPPDVVPKYETWRTAVHPDDIEAAEGLLQDAVAGKARFETEFRILVHGGEERHIQAAARVTRDADGNPQSVIGVNWDITQRKLAEAELKTERRRLGDIIRGTNVGTWEWNVQTGEVVFNERWANIVGYTLDEISPVSIDTWLKFAHPEDLEVSGSLLEKHFSGELEYYECEARMRHRNGDWIWVLDRGKVASWTDDGKPLLMSGTHKDITEQKQAEEKIRHLATHDTLTDLPTLRLARDRVRMAMAVAHRKEVMVAVLFVDLDGFKQVNDTLGHDAGDALLVETAKRLVSCVRSVDTVARIGGDEFLMILNELDSAEDVERIADKVVESIATPYVYGDDQLTVGASVGIATYSGVCDEVDIDELIRLADEAMYSIKKSGKNGYAFAGGECK